MPLPTQDRDDKMPMRGSDSARRCRRLWLLPLLPLLVTAGVVGAMRPKVTEPNLYSLQAEAWLRGRLDIDRAATDVAYHGGRMFVPLPPFPTVVLLPFVALFGPSANTVFVSMLVCALSVHVLARALRRLGVEGQSVPWLASALFLGTIYWWCLLESHGVWHFAHVVAVACMLLAINEALGPARGILVGLFLGLAFLSRQLSVYGFFFLAAATWCSSSHPTRRRKLMHVASVGAGLGVCIGVYMLLNYLRFGSPLDAGYSKLALDGVLKARFDRFGLFHPIYVPFNFTYMFLQGFHVRFAGSAMALNTRMDPFGTSLTFASPFVFFALAATWRRALRWAAWASVLLMLTQMLFYYNNGYAQVNGQRFALDFLPILMVLVALGVQRVDGRVWKAAVVYGVLLNVIALFGIPALRLVEKYL